jgi:prepilin-type N-terminal cleavage/methylation domain-containing protein
VNAKQSRPKLFGYTLTEIMIVVAMIGLLAALATPRFVRVRKLSQGKRIVNDARIIDAAVNGWAFENHKTDGAAIVVSDLISYSKRGIIPTHDVLGNPYGIGPVGTNQVRIAAESKEALAGVTIDWGGY